DYVRHLPACNGKVVVIGFCWGGSQTFRFATNNATIQAACPFYGSGPQTADEIERIVCPVYGFYAENDARVNASLPTSEALMKAAGKSWDLVVYAGAGHAFMRSGEAPDASPENSRARREAWQRLTEILSAIQ
ncbi:MAG TPA: dienelactone hydrolase family protein, partial [Pirellulaceae bacterium]|nr:dienelactone hydrolase family protein [Pirellulaceae bacterium]